MYIEVRHETAYRYDAPAKMSVQYLRLTPQEGAGQRVLRWHLEAPGLGPLWRDHFGNLCHTVSPQEPLEELRIVAAGAVETRDTGGLSPRTEGELPPSFHLRETAYTALDERIREFAGGYRGALAGAMRDGLAELMHGVADRVRYREGATHVDTTASQALADGQGVCQDQAHLFIAACRVLGVPARYVSGYLRSTMGEAESHSAGHAWAEAYLADTGWIGFDAANRTLADARHVRLALGSDYAGAGPVSGVRSGGGHESMAVSIQIQDQQ